MRYYLEHRDRAPTWAGFLRRIGRTLVLWAAVGAAVCYWCAYAGVPEAAWLYAGMLVGAALREARQHYHVSRAWPAIAAIIDWERAQSLAAVPDAEPGGVQEPGKR